MNLERSPASAPSDLASEASAFLSSRTGSAIAPDAARARHLPWRIAVAGAARLATLAVLSWALFFNLSEVRGSSMEPGIHDRDRILVDHVSYVLGDVERGDVVVLRYPLDPSLDYIKRIVGLPGDEILIQGDRVRVNGELLSEPYVGEGADDPFFELRVTVRTGHVFVLGDNRAKSSDSREFGQVALDLLRGKVWLRIWPLDRVGRVK